VRKTVAVFSAVAVLVAAPSAFACACCAEPGTHYEQTAKLQPFELQELKRVRFGTAAKVALGAAGFDAVHGIKNPRASYPVQVTQAGRTWTLSFGSSGALAFTLPQKATSFLVDVHDGKMGGGGGPLLYKELRMTAPVHATGNFHGARISFVLQGRGNDCLNGDDFKWWRLQISGGGADYAIYGALRRAAT
jgi:hypothetical protein